MPLAGPLHGPVQGRERERPAEPFDRGEEPGDRVAALGHAAFVAELRRLSGGFAPGRNASGRGGVGRGGTGALGGVVDPGRAGVRTLAGPGAVGGVGYAVRCTGRAGGGSRAVGGAGDRRGVEDGEGEHGVGPDIGSRAPFGEDVRERLELASAESVDDVRDAPFEAHERGDVGGADGHGAPTGPRGGHDGVVAHEAADVVRLAADAARGGRRGMGWRLAGGGRARAFRRLSGPGSRCRGGGGFGRGRAGRRSSGRVLPGEFGDLRAVDRIQFGHGGVGAQVDEQLPDRGEVVEAEGGGHGAGEVGDFVACVACAVGQGAGSARQSGIGEALDEHRKEAGQVEGGVAGWLPGEVLGERPAQYFEGVVYSSSRAGSFVPFGSGHAVRVNGWTPREDRGRGLGRMCRG